MNQAKTSLSIDLRQFEDMLAYINWCIENRSFDSRGLTFNVDWIVYSVWISNSASKGQLTGDLDIVTTWLDILDIFLEVIDTISKNWKVYFRLGSTDRHKVFVTISTQQEIDLVRQSIKSLTKKVI